MSHFATLVIHKEGADIDGILAPFCETDEDYPTLMPDEVITLRLMLRYIQREDL